MRSLAVAAACAAAMLFPAQNAPSDAGRVVLMLREHQDQQALSTVDGLLAKNPHDCRLLSLRGLALNSLHRPSEADKAFRNGIPVATVEVKTDFTQSADAAMEQYKNDRLPDDKATGRKEPLSNFKRGAVVHSRCPIATSK